MKAILPEDDAPRVRLWWHPWQPGQDTLAFLAADLARTWPGQTPLLARTPAGKPVLSGIPGHVGASHSGPTLVLAHADRPVGVDVERRLRERPWVALAERFFWPDEATRVAAAADPGDTFLRLWVAKEALLKTLGVGIAGALGQVETCAPDRDPAALRFRRLPPGADPARYRARVSLERGLYLGLVLECTIEPSCWMIGMSDSRGAHADDR